MVKDTVMSLKDIAQEAELGDYLSLIENPGGSLDDFLLATYNFCKGKLDLQTQLAPKETMDVTDSRLKPGNIDAMERLVADAVSSNGVATATTDGDEW